MEISEKRVQGLIADFPWLLNLNYQRVAELKNKGMEYVVGANQRIDLILKDSITGRPVIVEFKAVPFYRENIGQILEYRSRLISELSSEDSPLYEVIGDKLSSPVWILVVSEIDEEARIACNLSGIEVFEFEKPMSEFTKPEKRRTLEEVAESLNTCALPVTEDRADHIERLDQEIKAVLSDLNMGHGLKKFRSSGIVYHFGLENFFINRWLFRGLDYKVTIGFYEDIFEGDFDVVVFIYYSEDRASLEDFREKLLKYRKDNKGVPEITVWEEGPEYELRFNIPKKELLDDPRAILTPMLKEYTVVMKKAFGFDVTEF